MIADPLNPPLKWAGGKRWLVPVLTEIYNDHRNRRYVEPFCGGLAIALGLRPRIAYLNDINPHLINFYRQVKLHGLALHGRTTNVIMKYDSELYYRNRDRFNKIKDRSDCAREAAELFYYLNRTCFNGLCRFNSKGGFNVPFGQYTTVNYADGFIEHQKAFKSWSFTDNDFDRMTIEEDDFIYADPPYDVEFTTYSAGGFSWDDQLRLHNWLLKHRGPVVVSNQATPRVLELYKPDFQVETMSAPRRISRTGDRTPALEMLATRNL
jgi:DNA adenine methylase